MEKTSQSAKDHLWRPWHKVWPSHLPLSLKYPDVPAWWILERNLGHFDDREAILFLRHDDLSEISRHSYKCLYEDSLSLAAGLRELGVRKGDRVAIVLPNSPALIQSYFGIWLAGGTVVPNNPMAKAKELRKAFVSSEVAFVISNDQTSSETIQACTGLAVRIIVASPDRLESRDLPNGIISLESIMGNGKLMPSFNIRPDEDIAVIIYTGGTTGAPKGAMLTHRNIVVNTIQFAEWYDFEPGEETCVCVIPMSHSGGMSGVMNVPLYSGATLLVMERANPSAVGRAVQNFRATRLFGVPTLYAALLNDKEARQCDYSSLKACRTGAASLPVSIKEAFDALAQKEVLVEGYGLTETSPLCLANPIDCPKAGSIGIPLTDTDAKVVDIETGEELPAHKEGELLVRGPQIMKGYLNNPEATGQAIKDGWFRTGDVVYMDDEGRFTMVDRIKDFINASGFKVWPREIEEVLYTYPGVKLAAVIGIPDAYRGETVKAYIVPTLEAKDSLKPEEVIMYCKELLSAYKVQKIIEFREELPLSPAGKILRRLLKEKNFRED